jgi:hypothetical protein
MDLSEILISILMGIVIYFIVSAIDRRVWVVSSVDGEAYLVRNMPNKLSAANTLARMKKRIMEFNDYLYANYPNDPRVINIHNRLNIKSIKETPKSDSLTSYSLNKGEEISFCLRMKSNESKIHQDNVLMFVAIHELGHVASNEIGHGPEFLENFRWLLDKAEKSEFYYREDFEAKPFIYCGIRITNEMI